MYHSFLIQQTCDFRNINWKKICDVSLPQISILINAHYHQYFHTGTRRPPSHITFTRSLPYNLTTMLFQRGCYPTPLSRDRKEFFKNWITLQYLEWKWNYIWRETAENAEGSSIKGKIYFPKTYHNTRKKKSNLSPSSSHYALTIMSSRQ